MALQALLIDLAAGASPWKHAVRVVATSNITLSGLQTIDGVALAEGDRVLVAGQTDAKQNGIYDAKSSAWVRSSDLDDNSELKLGTITVALGGTTNQLSLWVLSSPTTGTLRLGSDNLTFTKLIDVDAVTALGITSTGDLTLTCAAASTIKCVEGVTEVCRVFDDSGVRSIVFQGAAPGKVESPQDLNLVAATGSVVIKEASTTVASFTDVTGKSTMSMPGTAGGRIQAPIGSQVFELQTGTGGVIKFQHDVNDTFLATLASSVSTWVGWGTSGTTLGANSGPMRLECASGSTVRIAEGATDVCYFDENGGLARIQGRGVTGSVFSSSAGYALFQGASYVGLQSDAAQIQFNAFNGVLDYYGNSVLRLKTTLGATTTNNYSSGVTCQFQSNGTTRLSFDGTGIGFYATAPIAKPNVTGSRANPEQALANALIALANLGLLTNSTTA